MFYYIKGRLEVLVDNFIAVDCGGVCFKIYTSISSKNFFASKLNSEVLVYTTLIVREDAQDLYGFSTEEELEIFKKLISVSGVGPKGAISILSYFSVESLCDVISGGDSRALSGAPGVGLKTAQKIIIELKDKLPKVGAGENVIVTRVSNANVSDAVNTLVALGYQRSLVLKVIEKIDKSGDTAEIITNALKILAKQ
jgi:Holliday junction DNA helicase RuvA